MKKNCWEFKGCGRGPEQPKTQTEPCPVASESRLHGVHGGKGSGRACWVVAGTLCEGRPQGSYVQKAGACQDCDFYERVRDEEYPDFKFARELLRLLKDDDSA